MEKGLIKVTRDKAKATSILKMAETSLEMVRTLDLERFPSNAVKEYYDIIREMASVLLLLDGYKTYGEGAHKKMIEYLDKNYRQFSEYEISVIDDLRVTRNRISYNGFFVRTEYIERKRDSIEKIIAKLREIIKSRL